MYAAAIFILEKFPVPIKSYHRAVECDDAHSMEWLVYDAENMYSFVTQLLTAYSTGATQLDKTFLPVVVAKHRIINGLATFDVSAVNQEWIHRGKRGVAYCSRERSNVEIASSTGVCNLL